MCPYYLDGDHTRTELDGSNVVIPMMPSLSKDGWGTNDDQPRWSGLDIV